MNLPQISFKLGKIGWFESDLFLSLLVHSEADKVKDEGNTAFKSGNYMEAIMKYTDAIALCPLSARKKQAIYYR